MSSTQHVLLTHSTRRPFRKVPQLPSEVSYDPVKGYWVVDGQPMATVPNLVGGPPSSKKCDQETGEDQKGE